MVAKRFYNIDEMSTILGKSISAIHGHLARRQYDAVPPPMKLGRRLAWLVEMVDKWIADKVAHAEAQAEIHKEFMQTPPKRKGRPTKTGKKTKRENFEN
ncbi:MAG: hypothetical protein LBJ14_08120 [Desulfarculales bacterium]|jgi:predicted DNA-binding transcriptional regulator AlpA|nr:hypothetical protein [Desulfarculales bacterium]